ncbi:hypothetical protein CHS0354_010923 [Potamilus streckersoni]|uniref:Uncharacterized protein n=1 Tax=Potamilus streckersoni TaxID=2493646 RepID=A0AAE0SSF3_9BIVA|nr:hypothetical protein CHS0354_010923 [Potamilus streckersoni]
MTCFSSRSSAVCSGVGSVYNATAVFSSGGDPSRFGVSSPDTYMDNSYNRSLGTVGVEHGSILVSRDSFGGVNDSSGAGVSSGACGFSRDDFSSNNCSCGSSSGGGGVYNETSGFSGVKTSSRYGVCGPRTSYNRNLGRVGLEQISLVVSRQSSRSGINTYNCQYKYMPVTVRISTYMCVLELVHISDYRNKYIP